MNSVKSWLFSWKLLSSRKRDGNPRMCVGGNWRINWIGGLSNHAPRMVSGIRGGEGVVGKPLITLQDCVMGLVSACVAIWARSTGLGAEHWRGCCVLWNLLSAEESQKLY